MGSFFLSSSYRIQNFLFLPFTWLSYLFLYALFSNQPNAPSYSILNKTKGGFANKSFQSSGANIITVVALLWLQRTKGINKELLATEETFDKVFIVYLLIGGLDWILESLCRR